MQEKEDVKKAWADRHLNGDATLWVEDAQGHVWHTYVEQVDDQRVEVFEQEPSIFWLTIEDWWPYNAEGSRTE